MSLLGEILTSYYAWLILGWVLGTGVLIGGAGAALVGRRVWDVVATPALALGEPAAERTRVSGGGHRYEVTVENDGRRAATDCRATFRLVGSHPESGAPIRVTRPVGWIESDTGDGIDPDGLVRSLAIPPGEARRLYLGHTTTVHYRFVFPDLPTAGGTIVRGCSPGAETGKSERRLPFRDLNETTWETAHLELRPGNADAVRFRIDFEAELAAQDPRLRFGRDASPDEGAAAPSAAPANDGGETERERAT